MNAPDFGKPFEELDEDEIAQLEAHDWTAGQIMSALSMAMEMGELEAAVSLLRRLALKDPKSAAAILAVIEATS